MSLADSASELVLDSLKVLSNEAILLLERNDCLSLLIQREILNCKLRLVEITEKETHDLKKNFLIANKFSDEKFTEFLDNKSLTEKEFLQQLSFQIREKKFLDENFANKCHSHFLRRKNDLDQILYSLIRTKEYFEAKELFLRVQEDESSFGKIAKKYSQGPERNSFGLIGPVPINIAHPKMRDVMRTAKIGETNEPFKVEDWWLIVRVEERREAELNQDMELKMKSELSKIWLKEEAQLIINNLRNSPNY